MKEWKAEGVASAPIAVAVKPKKQLAMKATAEAAIAGRKKKQTKLCVGTEKDKDVGKWYQQVAPFFLYNVLAFIFEALK